jgi:hypothetical protein
MAGGPDGAPTITAGAVRVHISSGFCSVSAGVVTFCMLGMRSGRGLHTVIGALLLVSCPLQRRRWPSGRAAGLFALPVRTPGLPATAFGARMRDDA